MCVFFNSFQLFLIFWVSNLIDQPCPTLTGNVKLGIELKKRRKSSCMGVRVSAIFLTSSSMAFILEAAKWQFCKKTHSPFLIAAAMSFFGKVFEENQALEFAYITLVTKRISCYKCFLKNINPLIVWYIAGKFVVEKEHLYFKIFSLGKI